MDESEFDPNEFIRIGQSLPMPGEINNDKLKRVPKKSWTGDARRPFFANNANSKNYYYMPIGDVPQHPHRNTLVPLGAFIGFDDYPNMVYFMRFSIPPYNNSEFGHISMDTNPLVYTDEPPVVGSVPLTYTDYLKQFYPRELEDRKRENRPLMSGDGVTGFGVSITGRRGGKKTKKRKNKKIKKTRKYKKRIGKI